MTIRPIFAWFDLWIGVFIDRDKSRVFIFPVPCFGFVISWAKDCPHEVPRDVWCDIC